MEKINKEKNKFNYYSKKLLMFLSFVIVFYIIQSNTTNALSSYDLSGSKIINKQTFTKDNQTIGNIHQNYHINSNDDLVKIPDNGLRKAIITMLQYDNVDITYDEFDQFIARDLLETVTILDASNREISDLTGINHLINLELLCLSYNNLNNQSLANNVFSNLTNLKELYLDNNPIKSLKTDNNSIFSSLNNLVYLNLDNTELTNESLSSEVFDDLINLHFLRLSHNKITSITSDFNNLTNLTDLALSHNQITTIANNAFNNLTKLRYLSLEYNKISDITSLERFKFSSTSHPDLRIILTDQLIVKQSKLILPYYNYTLFNFVTTLNNNDVSLNLLYNVPSEWNISIINNNLNIDVLNDLEAIATNLKILFKYPTDSNINFTGQLVFSEVKLIDKVFFLDNNLKMGIISQLEQMDEIVNNEITPRQMLRLNNLTLANRDINNLTGLEFAMNLKTLNLTDNNINNNTLNNFNFESLINLKDLNLANNYISDITSLEKLNNNLFINISNQKINIKKLVSDNDTIIINQLKTLIKQNLQLNYTDNQLIITNNSNQIKLQKINHDLLKNIVIDFNYSDSDNINFNGIIKIKELYFNNLKQGFPSTNNKDDNENINDNISTIEKKLNNDVTNNNIIKNNSNNNIRTNINNAIDIIAIDDSKKQPLIIENTNMNNNENNDYLKEIINKLMFKNNNLIKINIILCLLVIIIIIYLMIKLINNILNNENKKEV